MELSQQMIIDLALNAAAYLIAALLGITIYSICTHKRKQAVVVTEQALPKSEPLTAQQLVEQITAEEPSRKMEFIKFGASAQPVPQPTSRPTPAPTKTADAKPTKADIIKLARKMVSAGAPNENIKKVLPISDAELALLQLSNNS